MSSDFSSVGSLSLQGRARLRWLLMLAFTEPAEPVDAAVAAAYTSWPPGPALLPTCEEHGDLRHKDIRLREGRAGRHYLVTERLWDSARRLPGHRGGKSRPREAISLLQQPRLQILCLERLLLHQGGGNSPMKGITVEIPEELPVRLEDEMEDLVKE
ncbi:hypothetical protein BP00DRAFT_449591 [Aspergillus indologenus CBS 114.80]|uniref:Uncharacterized protein n=1 Tax=Aspergillus indologenus CBS 114.80 TaxID=1450541 RepID=A0A2V5HUK6_9EURO|nr:hypothetical protein BP00DRAFT_449591 [Aspergillus indologenus CBS 114.80]